MKPLAARACARPLTAPSTMTLLEQPNRARCTINCRIHRSLMERARSRSSAGYRPATLSLDSLVGSLAACPIASPRWRKGDSNSRSLPKAIYTEPLFRTNDAAAKGWRRCNARRCSRGEKRGYRSLFRGAAAAVDCSGTGGYQRRAAESSRGWTVTSARLPARAVL
jgi:hypothetical protein